MLSKKEIQLRKHKRIASGLFLVMALLYALMVYGQQHHSAPWMFYVGAFSEAAMVGALADWFAVTALFRYPLGLKIPHTNLIERKQKDLGENLGKFVKENFLNAPNIRPYIERLDVVALISNWLKQQNNQALLASELMQLFRKIIADLDDEEVKVFLASKSAEILKTIDYQKIASSGIKYWINNNEHQVLLDNILPELRNYVEGNQQLIRDRISENRPFISFLAGKKISREVTDGIAEFILEIEENDQHPFRRKLTTYLAEFSDDLLTSVTWKEKFEELTTTFVSAENLEVYAKDAWDAIKNILEESLEDPFSGLQIHLRKNIEKLSDSLNQDLVLRQRLNQWIRHFLYRMILKNSAEVEVLISQTVSGWEGKELSRKLELEVGKDLQYIRVNGTLVGGLVGLTIYTLTQLFL